MNMNEFKRYKLLGFAEARPVEAHEDSIGLDPDENISISEADRINGSPKLGDMIARNPNNHEDQWLIAADDWAENFEQEAAN